MIKKFLLAIVACAQISLSAYSVDISIARESKLRLLGDLKSLDNSFNKQGMTIRCELPAKGKSGLIGCNFEAVLFFKGTKNAFIVSKDYLQNFTLLVREVLESESDLGRLLVSYFEDWEDYTFKATTIPGRPLRVFLYNSKTRQIVLSIQGDSAKL